MNLAKKIAQLGAAAILIGSLLGTSSASAKPADQVTTVVPKDAFYIQGYVDNRGRSHDVIYIVQGVPSDSGVTLAWSGDKKSVTLTKGKTVLKLTTGQQTAYLNGKKINLEEKVRSTDDAIVAPLGTIAKKLSLKTTSNYSYSTYEKLKDRAAQEAALIAQYVAKNGMTISSVKTSDNTVYLWGPLKSAAPVLVKIVKQGELPRYKIADPIKGQLDELLYLSDGAGQYTVSLYDRATGAPLSEGMENLFAVTLTNKSGSTDNTYLKPTPEVNSDNAEIKALAKQITEGLTDDLSKTQAIHDWVSTHIAYDTEELFTGNIHGYTAVQILHRKKAVCDGYAKLTAALNRAAGIKAKVVWGMAGTGDPEPVSYINATDYNHAWVETYVNGAWIAQDTTWDAGSVTGESFAFGLKQKYFNPDPDVFAADHLAAFVMHY
ncbi:transglutaminase domain-containing protein [Cohnella caldifontis]|uniref:transglutaminase domain-containing protein n=1 Tax=Cohnella caldifontis TaxID=3027471 RepID=UPI0023EAE47B|nr:transglutaminase domain-containing protein [Cohnella sp. YIM B05605]